MSTQHSEPNKSKIAYNIGWDAGIYGIQPFDEWPLELRGGWAEARKKYPRPKKPDRFIRKWIQLRVGAYKRNKHFSEGVTPNYLKMIDTGFCPVTVQPFTYRQDSDSDWSLDRVDNEKGYVRQNLISLSRRVNMAKSDLSYADIEAASPNQPIAGLTAVETARLWTVISLFFRSEQTDIMDLHNYYLGQVVVPDAPVNWIMSLQILLSISIDHDNFSPDLLALIRSISLKSGNKRHFNKTIHRLCKFKAKQVAIPIMIFPEWANQRNCRNLRRWLRTINLQYRAQLQEITASTARQVNESILEDNLEKWAIDL